MTTNVTAETLAKLSPEEKRRLLAELLRKKQLDAAATATTSETPRVDPHAVFPLNDMQQAFWVGRAEGVQLGNIGIQAYGEIECRNLDVARASRALRQLIARHDMLRAVVLPDGTQRVQPEVPEFEIVLDDLSSLPEAEREARCLELRERMCGQAFDVQRWPLFDFRTLKLDAEVTRLAFCIDLIIADTRSVVTLLREWAEYYNQPGWAPAPLAYNFQQYVANEPQHATTASYRRAEAYWSERVAQLPAAPQLPLRIDPSSIVAPHFVRHAATLEAASWSRLKARGQQHGLTPSVIMCAAYAEVLALWSGQQHFVLNVIPAMRRPVHPHIDGVIGPFSSINLLEVDLRPHANFLERARAVQARLYEDLDHIDYSGVKVLRKLAQLRGTGLAAPMPVVFTSTMVEFGDLEGFGRLGYLMSQTPQVWIDHQLAEREGALLFNWDVVEELFPEGMVAEMFDAFARRVRSLADDPNAFESSDLDLLSRASREVRERANATAAPVRELQLHEAVWQWAQRAPDCDAVVCSARCLSYGELMREAQHLAERLRARGAGRNKLVAVSFAKGWEQVVSVLAVLEAGAAYLPLDPALPLARRQLLLETAQCELIVSSGEANQDLPEAWRKRILELTAPAADGGRSFPAVAERGSPALEPGEVADLAYVIFTSGSTGTPKGVMLSHRAVRNTLDDINERFEVGPEDRVLALSSLSFDLSVYDLFGVLGVGGCVVLPDPGNEREPLHWLELMRRERVTIWNSVPALLRLLVAQASGEAYRAALSTLRLVLLSGDWIPVTLPEEVRSLAPAARVISLGGATEAAIWSIHHPIDHVAPEWTSIPYGKPLRNQRFHVRNAEHRDCPTWVPGELYIGGAGLADGYFGDPERTTASFAVDPKSGERLYRTGDLGRYLPDGSLEFLGRGDAQVKIGGHRIELGEIEACLCRDARVHACCVRAIGDRHDKRLVAYVVAAESMATAGDQQIWASLREVLSQSLPEYMVPRHAVFLQQLPLTSNGKLDVNALPDPARGVGVNCGQTSAAAPADCAELERAIIEVWQTVLECTACDATANFFELGGDSLRMVRVRQALVEKLGREPSMVELYANPSPRTLAAHLVQQSQAVAGQAQPISAPARAGQSRAARRLRALRGTDGVQ